MTDAPPGSSSTTAAAPAAAQVPTADNADKSMDDIVALCKRRGFVYPASEIYGGLNGFWDYGPLGVQLKNNIRDSWWKAMVECPPIGPSGEPLQLVGLDSAIIQNPKAWVASGHVGGFNDPMVDDKETKQRFRADHLFGLFLRDVSDEVFSRGFRELQKQILDAAIPPHATVMANSGEEAERIFADNGKRILKNAGIMLRQVQGGGPDFHAMLKDGTEVIGEVKSLSIEWLEKFATQTPAPESQNVGVLTPPRMFNLMFETYVGAIRDDDAKAYLRPETAQGIFLNYKNVLDTTRVKVPFGIAQVGKAFRNEVTPRNFVFRSREFEQMEMEWFCHPSEAKQWKEFWQEQRMDWYKSIGLTDENLIFRDHDKDELSHYAKEGEGTVDIEYRWPFTAPGYGELEGIAHRTDYDLKAHAKDSGAKLEYVDPARDNERYYPHVIEPAAGLTRATLAVLCEAYTPTPDRKGSSCILKFNPGVAPVKAGVFPLVNKEGMPEIAQKLYRDLRTKYTCEYDPKQSIGRRYARMDEVGAPFCFTIDGQTLEDQTVTVRERDTASQLRIGIDKVEAFLAEKIG